MVNMVEYGTEIQIILEHAKRLAFEYLNKEVEPAHLLRGLLADRDVIEILADLDKDIHYFEEWADIRIESLSKVSKQQPEISFSDSLSNCLIVSEDIQNEIGADQLKPIIILAALAVPGIAFSYDQFKTLPLTKEELLKSIHAPVVKKASAGGVNFSAKDDCVSTDSGKPRFLGKYYHSKNMALLSSEKGSVVGRDIEIEYTIEILNRYTKSNVLIIGESGVGKTVLIDGVVDAIVAGKVPGHLKNAHVFSLDFGKLSIGASYKGEIEDRLKNVMDEIKLHDKPMLFIDEINILLSKNQGNEGIVNLIKSELEKGDLTIIATIGLDEYRKIIESDRSVDRRFEVVKLNEPDEQTALKILQSALPGFVSHHGFKIDDEIIQESIKLSQRYIQDKRLPDSAIDLVDRTMSNTRVAVGEVLEMLDKLAKADANKLESYLDEIERLNDKELVDLAPLIELIEEHKLSESDDMTAIKVVVQDKREEVRAIRQIRKHDLARVISRKTGIPVGSLQTEEQERLMRLEEELTKRVVGQEVAISAIASAILESRSGLTKEGQPVGSFFLMGPTGTGKTELAKALTEFLFQDERELIRFDMSEFKEEHSAALLYGAPPGYVGYEEGGLLVNKIREKPYSVVLFDEIEKAHTSVFDIFLQILDEGKLHDRLGKEGDFSNAVILFTSNIGSEHIVKKYAEGCIPKSKELMAIMSNCFRPEFLGRLTELVPFGPIDSRVVIDILNIQLKEIHTRLEKQDLSLDISEEAKQLLSKQGYTPEYGARPLKGIIRSEVRKKLSKMIIYGEVKAGDRIKLDANDEEEFVWDIEVVRQTELNEQV